MTGPAIARALGMARSTVGLILRRLGLGKLAALEPKAPTIRYERAAPGEMIHLDIKKLGRFDVTGHRITGDRRKGRTYRAGWTKDVKGARITRESSMAKLFATEEAQKVIDSAVQIFGGLGVTRLDQRVEVTAHPGGRQAQPVADLADGDRSGLHQ